MSAAVYDPFVHSLGVKCFVFSSNISLQAALKGCEISAQGPKRTLLRSESAVCSFAYFCCCNGKCGAMCCSCRHSCAGACKGSSLGFVRSIREIAASHQVPVNDPHEVEPNCGSCP